MNKINNAKHLMNGLKDNLYAGGGSANGMSVFDFSQGAKGAAVKVEPSTAAKSIEKQFSNIGKIVDNIV